MKITYAPLVAAISAACLLCGCAQSAPQESDPPLPTPSGSDPAPLVELIADIPTTQYFTDEGVSEDDIDTIVLAGINAPSAMNGQPWHFSVITDAAVLEQISEDMSGGFGGGMPPSGAPLPGGTPPEGFSVPKEGETMPPPPASGSGGLSKAGLTDAPLAIVISCVEGSALDAGLACQNMSVTAQLLGYGTKIISSPTMALNGGKQAEYRELLGIPENQAAAAILLIGKEDTSIDPTADGYTGATARNPLDDMVTYVGGN